MTAFSSLSPRVLLCLLFAFLLASLAGAAPFDRPPFFIEIPPGWIERDTDSGWSYERRTGPNLPVLRIILAKRTYAFSSDAQRESDLNNLRESIRSVDPRSFRNESGSLMGGPAERSRVTEPDGTSFLLARPVDGEIYSVWIFTSEKESPYPADADVFLRGVSLRTQGAAAIATGPAPAQSDPAPSPAPDPVVVEPPVQEPALANTQPTQPSPDQPPATPPSTLPAPTPDPAPADPVIVAAPVADPVVKVPVPSKPTSTSNPVATTRPAPATPYPASQYNTTAPARPPASKNGVRIVSSPKVTVLNAPVKSGEIRAGVNALRAQARGAVSSMPKATVMVSPFKAQTRPAYTPAPAQPAPYTPAPAPAPAPVQDPFPSPTPTPAPDLPSGSPSASTSTSTLSSSADAPPPASGAGSADNGIMISVADDGHPPSLGLGSAFAPAEENDPAVSKGPVLSKPDWALKPEPSHDFKALSKAGYNALGSTLSAGMTMLAGEGKAPLMNSEALPPTARAAGADAADLLARAASLKQVQETSLGSVERSWEEAVIAAQYGDELATREALALAASNMEAAVAVQNGIIQLARTAESLPPLPNDDEERAKANEAYRRLYARTRAFAQTPEEQAAANKKSKPGYKLVSVERLPPLEGQVHSGSDLNGVFEETIIQGSNRYVKTLRWTVPRVILPGSPARISITGSEKGGAISAGGIGLCQESKNYPGLTVLTLVRAGINTYTKAPSVESDHFDLILPDIAKSIADMQAGKDNVPTPEFQARNETLRDLIEGIGNDDMRMKVPSQIPLKNYYFSVRRHPPEPLDLFLRVFSTNSKNTIAICTYKWSPDCTADAADPGEWVEPPLPENLPSDKIEAIRFHRENIKLIERNLAKDLAELARETDSRRRADLEWRILQARSDVVAEKDLIASIEQGTIVRSRTPFDDYAHNRFVESIRENQRDMKNFQRERAAIPRLLALMPADRRKAMQDFVNRQMTPQVLAKMDHAKLREIANALNEQVQGHWQGEAARNTDQAEMYNDYLVRAERVKFISDAAVTIGTLGGGSTAYHLGAAYSTGAGLATGGPAEAAAQLATAYNAPVTAVVQALRAYPKDGFWGATKAGAIGFMMSKFTQLGNPGAAAEKLTVKEAMALKRFEEAKAKGEALVQEFQQARSALVEARSAGKSIEEVRALERALAERAAIVQTDLHAKAFLKYRAGDTLKRDFVREIDAIHNEVEARFHKIMAEGKWSQQELKAIRNSSSAGSVNMDFDIMLVERPGMNLTKDGSARSLNEWQEEAQKAWNRAFQETTGRDAGKAMEEVTTSMHPEAYKDLAWIGSNKSEVTRRWATQAGDVTRYKAQNVMGSSKLGEVDYYTRLMEAARGTAKDIDTKLLDRLRRSNVGTAQRAERRTELVNKWKDIQGLLKDIGEGRIDPVHGDRMVRNMTGGFGINDVVDHAATLQGEFTKRFSGK